MRGSTLTLCSQARCHGPELQLQQLPAPKSCQQTGLQNQRPSLGASVAGPDVTQASCVGGLWTADVKLRADNASTVSQATGRQGLPGCAGLDVQAAVVEVTGPPASNL